MHGNLVFCFSSFLCLAEAYVIFDAERLSNIHNDVLIKCRVTASGIRFCEASRSKATRKEVTNEKAFLSKALTDRIVLHMKLRCFNKVTSTRAFAGMQSMQIQMRRAICLQIIV